MKNKKAIRIYLLLPFLFFCIMAVAQLPVSEEPHHKVVFENGYIRILEGRIPVNDTTLAHIHAAQSIVVFLSKSTFGIQVVGGAPIITDVSPGDTKFVAYGEKPVTHIVWNQGTDMFHFLVVEMVKKYPENDTCPVISQPGAKFQWQQKLVRTYNLDIAKSTQYNLPKSNCAYLLIAISGSIAATSSGSKHLLNAGGFVYFPPQSDIRINSSNKENAGCVLLQLK